MSFDNQMEAINENEFLSQEEEEISDTKNNDESDAEEMDSLGEDTELEAYDDEFMEEAQWYVVHTYSGYENKVKANIEKIIENRNMQDLIWDVVVPMEEQMEIKDGKKKTTYKKVFPGYVLVKMIITDETWYVVRNTTGVTGFVGPESKPIPLTANEISFLGIENVVTTVDFAVNDSVMVTSGPLENFVGTIEEIYMDKKKVRVAVSMFGRETPVELEFTQISKI